MSVSPVLVPHYKDNFAQPVSISDLKRESSSTFDFLKRFEQPLRARSGYRQLHRERPEFYVVGNIGNYTLASYKVIFKDLTEFFQCAVVEPSSIHDLTSRPVIPDHTLLFTVCQTRAEAHFLAGILNSIPARVALYSASVGVQTQRYFPTDVSRIHLPIFNPDDDAHREVVRLSTVFHKQSVTEDDFVPTNSAELELARAAAHIWNISEKELRHLVKFHSEIRAFRDRRLAVETVDCDGENG